MAITVACIQQYRQLISPWLHEALLSLISFEPLRQLMLEYLEPPPPPSEEDSTNLAILVLQTKIKDMERQLKHAGIMAASKKWW